VEFESNLMNGYYEAYRVAINELTKKDLHEMCLNTNSVYDSLYNSICVKYLNKEYLVDCETGTVVQKDSEQEVSVTVKILILHYLINAGSRPLTGKMISFKEIPGAGKIYYQTFYKRSIEPLIKTFSNNFEAFINAVEKLNGEKEKYGHISATIKIFPMVPVTYVLWEGDDEVDASGTILFDESVTSFLPEEDIICAASFGVYEMIRLSHESKQ
jgi:hypothetical protein